MTLVLLARDLVLLRRGPQDAPYAPGLVPALAAVALALDAWAGSIAPASAIADARVALAAVGAALAGLLGASAFVLGLAGRQARFVQTAVALLLIEIALGLLSLPFVLMLGNLPAAGTTPAPGQALATFGVLAIGVWQLLVRGHVLRHALEVPLGRGVLLALAITLTEGVLAVAVVGTGTAAPASS